MNENLIETLTQRILSNIPKNKKPVNFLMDTLNIGRESTYRRIRGNIPFTFEEIAKLAVKLNISLDEIVGKSVKYSECLSDLQEKEMSNSDKVFFTNHLNYYELLETISASEKEKIEITYSLNRLISFFVTDYDNLFKFYYYLWINQSGENPMNLSFSEIELPSYMVSIQQKIRSKIALLRNVTFILDQNIIVRLIQELQYYYNRKLISYETLMEIKADILCFLDSVEKYIRNGTNDYGAAYFFYISLLNVDMNSMYGTFNDNVISRYWSHLHNPVNSENNDMIEIHKNWIRSLKRSSILISQSNEIVRASFLNQQRKFIETITNDLFFYYG